jgi:hypothetical protein
MITKDTFLVSFNIQGEGFCEPFLVTYRTEELNPYPQISKANIKS